VTPSSSLRILKGKYALFDEFASGGMGSVHFARTLGHAGFSRIIALKRLHPQFARDPGSVRRFFDEARLVSRIRHPNVITALDLFEDEGEVFLAMEYVHGASVAQLVADDARLPREIALAIVFGALSGLHAAHEATDANGASLGIVHRDISPQNILLGVDGVPRVVDFGVAKAAARCESTRDGQVKGKIRYMAPEQLSQSTVDRRADIHSMGVVLYELVTGAHPYPDAELGILVSRVLQHRADPCTLHAPDLPDGVVDCIQRAMAFSAEDRFPTALAMAEALEPELHPSHASILAAWAAEHAGNLAEPRARRIRAIENERLGDEPPASAIAAVPATEGPTQILSPAATVTEPVTLGRVVPHWWTWLVAAGLVAAAAALAFAKASGTPSIDASTIDDRVIVASSAPKHEPPSSSVSLSETPAPSATPFPSTSARLLVPKRSSPRSTTPPAKVHAGDDCKRYAPDGTFRFDLECLRNR
jgi:eukaryotic-like serine/threonine-protein kinase